MLFQVWRSEYAFTSRWSTFPAKNQMNPDSYFRPFIHDRITFKSSEWLKASCLQLQIWFVIVTETDSVTSFTKELAVYYAKDLLQASLTFWKPLSSQCELVWMYSWFKYTRSADWFLLGWQLDIYLNIFTMQICCISCYK